MPSAIPIELAVAGATILLSVVIGYLSQKGMGAFLLGMGALLASALCIAGTWLGWLAGESTGGWIGLIAGILISAVLAWPVGNKLTKGSGGPFVMGLWLGYCVICIYGYLAGGWLGLLLITVPCMVLFWVGMYRISAYLLPLGEPKQQHPSAFRSLVTFTMGTNYPFYVAQEGKLDERVKGDVYNQLFAGPGVLITRADQTAFRESGIKVLGIADPGVTFTQVFELPPKVVDLRPQISAFPVEALTRDGIPIQVTPSVIFRIERGRREPSLGQPFPFRKDAVFEAMTRRPVERGSSKDDAYEHQWNVDLAKMVGTRVVQDIVNQYRVDDLCAADSVKDPRLDMVAELSAAVGKELAPYGIEVLGSGIGNLEPKDDSIVARRIENWRTAWVNSMLVQLTAGDAERERHIQQARAEAEAAVVVKLAGAVEDCLSGGPATEAACALRFVDCLGEIVSETESQWPPPKALESTLNQLRGKLVEEHPKLKAPEA